jgi:hypothetical protein
MAASAIEWPVRSHQKLEQLADNLWRVVAPVPGMLIRRQMVIAADVSGRLLIHSCVALNAAEQARLEALGEPTWLVVPNGFHRLDAAAYKRRYPGLIVIAPEGSRGRVAEVVAVEQTYREFCSEEGLGLEQAPWPNAKEGIVRVRSGDGVTLVFNDLLFNPPKRGIAGLVYRAFRQGPQVPWVARRLLVDDVQALREWLCTLAATPDLRRAIPAHGEPILEDAGEVLRSVARRL